VSVGQVGVGVSSSKVGQRSAVHDGRLGEAELLDEDGSTVGTGDTVHAVEEDGGSLLAGGGRGVEVLLDEVEVEDVAEEGDVVGDGVDDLDLDGSDLGGTDLLEVDLRKLTKDEESKSASSDEKGREAEGETYLGESDRLVLLDGLGDLVDGLGDVLSSGSSTKTSKRNERTSAVRSRSAFSPFLSPSTLHTNRR
jgi:hypothetical protein